jgi:hypothetical protein
MSAAMPAYSTLDPNSAFREIQDIDGIHVQKSVTLTGNGASTENLFQVTGTCQVKMLFGFCTEATDSTTLSNFKWELWDSTAATNITGTVNASGAVAGALVYKEALLVGAAVFANPTTGLVVEPAANKKTFEPFIAMQKTGANTYIRLSYTGDATSDTDWTFEIHYVPFQDTALIVAV